MAGVKGMHEGTSRRSGRRGDQRPNQEGWCILLSRSSLLLECLPVPTKSFICKTPAQFQNLFFEVILDQLKQKQAPQKALRVVFTPLINLSVYLKQYKLIFFFKLHFTWCYRIQITETFRSKRGRLACLVSVGSQQQHPRQFSVILEHHRTY